MGADIHPSTDFFVRPSINQKTSAPRLELRQVRRPQGFDLRQRFPRANRLLSRGVLQKRRHLRQREFRRVQFLERQRQQNTHIHHPAGLPVVQHQVRASTGLVLEDARLRGEADRDESDTR